MNFNDCIEIPNKYLGSDKKKTILINGEKYLLKFPDPVREKGRELSYINNAISEYIGCKIYESVGIPTQEVLLGTYVEKNNKIKVSCACKDFCKDGFVLYEAEGLMLSNTDDFGHRTELSTVLGLIDKFEGIKKELKDRIYDMFIMDYLICNPDRHNGNWGILLNELTGKMEVAPVYDCGSCLSPLGEDSELTNAYAKNCSLNHHSALLLNGKRIMSSRYIRSHDNKDLDKALKRIVPKIDIDKIYKIINEISDISEVRKNFYKEIIKYGYSYTLHPAYEEIIQQEATEVGKKEIIKTVILDKKKIIQMDDKFVPGKKFNVMVMPTGTILDGEDISGARLKVPDVKEEGDMAICSFNLKSGEPKEVSLTMPDLTKRTVSIEKIQEAIDQQRENKELKNTNRAIKKENIKNKSFEEEL